MPTTIAPEARLSPYLAQNYLINGGFETWQRGVGPFTTTSFNADEWQYSVQGGETIAVTQETVNVKIGTKAIKLASSGTPGGGLQQGIECYKQLEGLWVTFSIWVKASSSAVYTLIGDYNGSTEDYSSAAYHTGSGNWERLTCTKLLRTGLAARAGWPHSYGLRVGIATVANTIYLDGAMLVVGNYPEGVPFVPVNPTEDFHRCQKFYQFYAGLTHFSASQPGNAPSSTWLLPVKMFSAPTLTATLTTLVNFASGFIYVNDNLIEIGGSDGPLTYIAWAGYTNISLAVP